MNYKEIVENIIDLLGGHENITQHASCMTRLRITIKDKTKINLATLKQLEGVLGLNENGDELQLIFGPGKVDKARAAMDELRMEFVNQASINQVSEDKFEEVIAQQKASIKAKQTSSFQGFMSKFANIFVPLIPGFIAAGMLAGFVGLFKELGVSGQWLPYMAIFNKSLMTFMVIMIGFNASKAFGGSGVVGGILAGLFILSYQAPFAIPKTVDPAALAALKEQFKTVIGLDFPALPTKSDGLLYSGMQSFFGFNIDPRGGMIGVLITAITSAYLEIFLRKRFSWEATDIITTPLITLMIMGAMTFCVVMPISQQLFKAMEYAFSALNGNPIGASILAGLFLPSVMMGIHQGFVPVYQALVQATGMNSLFPILAMAGAGQVGAAIALYVKSPAHSKLRTNIRGAIIPGFLGIGEPLIYGVTLPRVKPFFTAMAGGAVGGFYVGLMAWMGFPFGLNTVFGSSGLLGTFAMTAGAGKVILGMILYLSALVISYIAGFLITLAFGTKDVDLS